MGIRLLAEAAESSAPMLGLVNINTSTIIFTLINTLIIFLLYKFLLHNKVMEIFHKRQEKINADISAAEKAKTDAEAAKADYLEKISRSKEEAQEIVANAVKKAGARENEIIAEAEKNAALIREKAEESAELEKKRAMNEVKDQISDIVIMAAQAVAEKEISEKDNEELINSFLVNVGEEK